MSTYLSILSGKPGSLSTHSFPFIDLADVELAYSRGGVLEDGVGNDPDSDSGLPEPPLSDCEPPLSRAPSGRPSNKKGNGDGPRNLRNLRRRLIEGGELPNIPDRAPPRCASSCKSLGHYVSNCTRPHLRSGFGAAVLCGGN